MATDSDWLGALPRSVRQRFEGLGSYVSGVLEEYDRRSKLNRSQIQEIHLRIFIEELSGFFIDGSRAAARAVDAFEQLGIHGFRIGNETFAGRNEAVTRGQRLAEALSEATGDAHPRGDTITEVSLRDRILQLAREIDERRVD
jgi:hypothetical protein